MDNQYQTLSEATTALNQRGYTLDFELKSDKIICRKNDKTYLPSDFHIDEFHRFEGMSNPGDMSIVFAISTTDGDKGVLVDAYGTYSDPLSSEMIEKIRIH